MDNFFKECLVKDPILAWTRFRGHSANTPIIEEWEYTQEDNEFDNYEIVPIWGEHVDNKYNFAITMKTKIPFDGTGGETFKKRASRKSESILVQYFETKAEMVSHPLLNGYSDWHYYVFCWERGSMDKFENGVYWFDGLVEYYKNLHYIVRHVGGYSGGYTV